MEYSMYKGI